MSEEFDRWLAKHDSEIAATAWEQGFIVGVRAATGELSGNPENPYLNE